MTADRAFTALAAFDPDLAHSLASARRPDAPPLPETVLSEIADTILTAYGQNIPLGAAVAEGYRMLMADADPQAVIAFGREIRRTCGRSAALGQHVAGVLPAILQTRDERLVDAFHRTLAILLAKGDYLVRAPLAPLAALAAEEAGTAHDYLALLQTVFRQPLSYNRCQYLGNLLPRTVTDFKPNQRRAWIRQMARLGERHLDLIEAYLEGLSQGLALLSAEALHQFIDQVLAEADRDAQAARRFLALRAHRGRDVCRSLQTAATLEGHMARLNRYLAARIGHSGRISPLSVVQRALDSATPDPLLAASDGACLYLPDIVDRYADQRDNVRLLTAMAKFEAGLIEFGTFTFDMERARDLGCLEGPAPGDGMTPNEAVSDFTIFSRLFDNPRLALDLLTLYEHARVRVRLARAYPGLVRSALPFYQSALRDRIKGRPKPNLLEACYGTLALAMPGTLLRRQEPRRQGFVDNLAAAFAERGPETMRVEHSAGLVAATYHRVQAALLRCDGMVPALCPPYRLPLQADFIEAAERDVHPQVERLLAALEACGVKPYRGDLRQLLQNADGRPSVEDILALPPRCRPEGMPPTVEVSPGGHLSPEEVLVHDALAPDIEDPDDVDRIGWYKEWNASIGDYLHDHVRVRDRRLAGGEPSYYTAVLERRQGLVRRIRRSFELLRPEGLALLRQWVEGDDFDYRALLDFALDRKAGRLPSDRLYIKRVKQRRDVAVMLLVDLSRSTSNIVKGSNRTVLDVAKEAVVLFTQALAVVGDDYAVAGYSGTGRLGVDFFRIKDFDDTLDNDAKATLCALAPQRSTRMGAAVRRASEALMTRDNRVKLLLMIGDGFPNDTAYKGDYAVEDTRQAIAEARSSGIITQAITVNLPYSPRLDALFGPVRHTVISQVDELPDKLLRLYGTLTRL